MTLKDVNHMTPMDEYINETDLLMRELQIGHLLKRREEVLSLMEISRDVSYIDLVFEEMELDDKILEYDLKKHISKNE